MSNRAAPTKRKLNDQLVTRLRPAAAPYLVWDTYQGGLAVRVRPSGAKSFVCIYRTSGRPRWLRVAATNAIGVKAARKLAAEHMLAVANGRDPAAERRALRFGGTFADLAARYREVAKRKNKSWSQAASLIDRYVMPRFGKLAAKDISGSDMKSLHASIAAPILANQVLLNASAIFSWGVKQELVTTNPCKLVDRHPTASRDRVLTESELPQFWMAFDDAGLIAGTALKLILLTGQRPGEVLHLRREQITDGWWELPGAADAKTGWPGTKNGQTHRVYLPPSPQALLLQFEEKGFAFAGVHGKPVAGSLDAAMSIHLHQTRCSAGDAPRLKTDARNIDNFTRVWS